MDIWVPIDTPWIVMENGLRLHAKVIGLPWFRTLVKQSEKAQESPSTPVKTN